MLLQLAGLIIIGWAAVAPAEEPMPAPARPLLLLAMLCVAVATLQAVPLPSSIWAHGARARIVEDFHLFDRPVPPLPVSLTPYASVSALLACIPPLAMFCAIVRLKAYRFSWLAAALLAGTTAGIMLGALQVVSAGPDSPWYLYPQTNLGSGVGFFANANHMADLLVITLPFLAAVAAAGRSGNIQRYSAIVSLLVGVAILLLVGIALNGSLAGYVLAVPVLAASVLILLPQSSRWRGWLTAFVAFSVFASIVGLASSSIGGTKLGQGAGVSVQSREQILRTTGKAMADFMPYGSGLGSFVKVYRLYESPAEVSNEYVIHAHNDYAELALELGAPGIILMLLFLAWWVFACLAVWRKGQGGPWARAASIASAAILVHSLVDFPLRTAAISTCFAMCLALLADRRVPLRQDAKDLRPTRHIVIA
jgi:O-antigen ligase